MVRGNRFRFAEAGIRPRRDRCDAGLGFAPDRCDRGQPERRPIAKSSSSATAHRGRPVLCNRPLIVDAVAQGVQPARVRFAVRCVAATATSPAAAEGRSAAGGPARDDFRTGIGLLTAALFPSQNPQRHGGPACAFC
jgi:hypothetical protein